MIFSYFLTILLVAYLLNENNVLRRIDFHIPLRWDILNRFRIFYVSERTNIFSSLALPLSTGYPS